MFVVTRSDTWNVSAPKLMVTQTIEAAELWIQGASEDDEDGEQFFVYRVEVTPAMKYTTIREVRGDAWDGPTE